MIVDPKWRQLGWRHMVWDLVRYCVSLRSPKARAEWRSQLERTRTMQINDAGRFPIEPESVQLFFDYLQARERAFQEACGLLRTEAEALAFCTAQGTAVGKTTTRSQEHHQSSKALVAAVSSIAARVCHRHGIGSDLDPSTRCVWCAQNGLHVTARNLDGAVPSLANPTIVWEIKEYWGKTKGGSKMSDALYECNLVGRELREFEEGAGISVTHVVFMDGKEQWGSRESDLKRFVDLYHQGVIDHLFIGREVETEWEPTLDRLLSGTVHQATP